METQQVSCPVHGIVMDIISPNPEYPISRTEKPTDDINFKESTIECPDSKKHINRRKPHSFPVYWIQKGISFSGGPLEKSSFRGTSTRY